MNLAAALGAAAERTPDAPALAGADPVSHGALARRVAAAARKLAAQVAPGERVAILAGNETAFVVAYLAVLRAGAVAVPLNGTSPSHEVAGELDTVAPAVVFSSPALADLARRAVSQSNTNRAVLVLDGTEESADAF